MLANIVEKWCLRGWYKNQKIPDLCGGAEQLRSCNTADQPDIGSFLTRHVKVPSPFDQNETRHGSGAKPGGLSVSHNKNPTIQSATDYSRDRGNAQEVTQPRILTRAKDLVPEESGQLLPFKYKDLVIKKLKNVKKSIGEGGFGRVFMATIFPKKDWVNDQGRKKLSRVYAVKINKWITSFKIKEAKCLRAAGEFGFTPWYKKNCVVMHDKGASLDKLLPSGNDSDAYGLGSKIIPANQRHSISKQAMQCLQKIHSKGILHSDIKPGNIAINSRGEVSLIDFGLAIQSKGQVNSKTEFKTLSLTPRYCSPEAFGKKTATQKLDIWAMGMVMLEMETGHSPVMCKASKLSEVPIMHRYLCMLKPECKLTLFAKFDEEAYRRTINYIEHNPRISQECKEVLLACFELDPDKRPTAEELLNYPYFREKELHEMSSMELNVAHGNAFKALVEAEKAIEAADQSTSGGEHRLQENLERCQSRVKEIQNRIKALDERAEELKAIRVRREEELNALRSEIEQELNINDQDQRPGSKLFKRVGGRS
ncbi:protein kinase [Endozoicomonas sp. SCSIO W0465]|uniref:protein kinase domain-containing protein n=1 Tax=Endozoicomonas sp. SCSIO W0465 TaxID=2918516 RepID=UPI002074FF2A|nr:protein kinase [Endozoicomonas sp. SCSIO W0465]USE34270.1 protein kinase [Endozoicomonas sp. SCSIO W0465]